MASDLKRKAVEMRNAIDAIESALMGFGVLVDLPQKWGEPRHRPELGVKLDDINCGQVYRLCDALAECTRIVNSNEYNPDELK